MESKLLRDWSPTRFDMQVGGSRVRTLVRVSWMSSSRTCMGPSPSPPYFHTSLTRQTRCVAGDDGGTGGGSNTCKDKS
jgi:hypothetical protein